MGARLLQPWHQMRSERRERKERERKKRGSERASGSDAVATYAAHTLAGLAHSGCKKCEDDGRKTGYEIWNFVSHTSAAMTVLCYRY